MDSTNPSHPDFWNTRYASKQTPWDFGGVPRDLTEFLRRKNKGTPAGAPGRVLIPGCGSGYEIRAFADAGFDVTAIDISAAAVERARGLLGPTLAGRVLHGDFFQHGFTDPFDVIYERTFLCAILPERRNAYRDRMAQLLKYGGSLIGYFYYQKPELANGPPFGLAWGEADELFQRYFILTKDVPVNDSLPVFAGRERWQERRRTAYSG